MANHRMPKKRRARNALVVAATAAGLSGTLVLGHATNTTAENMLVQLTNTVIAAGGQGNPTSDRVPAKLGGAFNPDNYAYDFIEYPATINLASSRDIGIPKMHAALVTHSGETFLIVAGYSEGTLIAEQVRRDLQATPEASAPPAEQLKFVMIASPFVGDGGILARFPWLNIPTIIDPMGAGVPTRYDTTYYANEYDPYADFPAYFNPVSLVNSLFAVRYAHPDEYYDSLNPDTSPHVQKVVDNGAGGTDTYVLFLNPHLPLFGPVREVAGLLSLSPLTEPLLGAIEPLVRLIVDMSYTDRTYANPEKPTQFSLITPPGKFIEALVGVPGALAQGATNVLSGGQALTQQDTPFSAASAVEGSEETGGNQRQTLAVAPEPTVAAVDEPPKADVKPDEKPKDQITHPTVTSDGNKVTPTTTVGGSTPGNGQVVDEATTATVTKPVEAQGSSPTTAGEPESEPAPGGAGGATESAAA